MKEKILLADDVDELVTALGAILEHNNYDVDIVHNGKEALEKACIDSYDCIIMDIMMPVMDGVEAVKQMRKQNVKIPIILLTAKSMVDDKVEGLDSGADDYLTKPFEKKELLARIRALTRTKEENEEKYEIGNIVFDKGASEISRNKISFHLNKKECEMMEFLVKNQELKISEDDVRQRIWKSEESNNDNIVPMYITYLQEKFNALNSNVKITNNNGYSLETIYENSENKRISIYNKLFLYKNKE